jgi:hypothetical protein
MTLHTPLGDFEDILDRLEDWRGTLTPLLCWHFQQAKPGISADVSLFDSWG